MSIRSEISLGIEPVRAFYDLPRAKYQFWVDGKFYEADYFATPFTLKNGCADKALVLRHARPVA